MRKIILLTAVAVIAATAVVWSIVTFSRPKTAFLQSAEEGSASVSPHEIMIKQGRTIPVEYWSHPF
jgi:hypothetical protein